jgi:DNA-directed RNA polymerase specialized sigma24 family protein
MDDASLEQACVEIVEAAADVSGGAAIESLRARLARAAATIAPFVERQVRAVAARNAKLFRDARLEMEDVAQEVVRRLIESPPRNPEGRDPVAAVLGWARAVAINVLLDRRRRTAREIVPRAVGTDEDDSMGAREAASDERSAADVLVVLGDIERMHVEAEHLTAYKHLRETFRVLVTDPDVSALELAQRVGLVGEPDGEPMSDEYRARARKAAQYAWKLRQRTLDLLAARMGCGRRIMTENGS